MHSEHTALAAPNTAPDPIAYLAARMNRRFERFCAWSGPLFVLLAGTGFVLAGLLPPMAPDQTVTETASHWTDDQNLKRLGLVLMMWGALFQVPFGALMAIRIKKMTPGFPLMAWIMVASSATALLAVTMPAFFFAVAAFRGDRSPELVQLASDLGWMPFVMNTPPALLQCGVLAAAVLADPNPTPVLPRWVGYYNIWTLTLFLPGGLCLFFMDGPLAWNGLLSYWVVAVLFGAWFLVMGWVLNRSIEPVDRVADNAENRR